MNKTIGVDGNALVLRFDFNPVIVDAVRDLPARSWNKQDRVWRVPIEYGEETIQALRPYGFKFTSPAVKAMAIERLRQATGDEARFETVLPLFPFQKHGAAFLVKRENGILAFEPGLGKTVTIMAVCEVLQAKRVLFLTMASLKYGAGEEIRKFMPNQSFTVVDGVKNERNELWRRSTSYMIANYELLLRDMDVIPRTWDVIVCDEATRLSNPQAKTVKCIQQLQAPHRFAMTGTPIQNTPGDLWGIVNFVRPGYLGSYWQFRQRYSIADQWGGIMRFMNLGDLKKRVDKYMIRRTKEEVLHELPAKTYSEVVFPLSEAEMKVYNAIREELLAEVIDVELAKVRPSSISNMLVKMLRLKQIADSLELVGEKKTSAKIDAVKELLESIIVNGQKAVLFTQFAEMSKILVRELQEYHPICIRGEIPASERQKAVEEFHADPMRRVAVFTEAGAYGLNLQKAAATIVHVDLPWSISKARQREDRVHRIGQDVPVTVYTMTAKGTIDEYVRKILYTKQKVSSDLLGDTERLDAFRCTGQDIRAMLEKEV